MAALRSILRLLLLAYALYTFGYGVWAIVDPENAWGGNLPLDLEMPEETIRIIGLGQAVIGAYEFLAAWRGGRAAYLVVAAMRTLSYVVLNRVWEWGSGWPQVDLNLIAAVVAIAATLD